MICKVCGQVGKKPCECGGEFQHEHLLELRYGSMAIHREVDHWYCPGCGRTEHGNDQS
jgi:hypothetical protein